MASVKENIINTIKWLIPNLEKKFAAIKHSHTKSQITDFPTSMPASDVYDWAKSSEKPSYSLSEIGAGALCGDNQTPLIINGVTNTEASIAYQYQGNTTSYWVAGPGAGSANFDYFGFFFSGIGQVAKISKSGDFDSIGHIQCNGIINSYSEYQSCRGSGQRDWRFGSATGSGDQNWFGFSDTTYGYHGGIYGPEHILRMNGEIQSTNANAFRSVCGNYGFILRNDGVNLYFMTTNSGDPWGAWNDNYSNIDLASGQWALKDNKGNRGYPVLASYNDTYRVVRIQRSGDNFRFDDGNGTARYCTGTTSDIRLKKDIQDTEIIDALSIINSIKVRSFNWKETNEHQKIGFVADELEKIDPKLAYGGGYTEDGGINTKVVDNFYLQGYVIKAIQELSNQVSLLVQENQLLKQKINK